VDAGAVAPVTAIAKQSTDIETAELAKLSLEDLSVPGTRELPWPSMVIDI